MLGLKIPEEKILYQPRGILDTCTDTIRKWSKEGYFRTSIPSLRLVPREKCRKLCQH